MRFSLKRGKVGLLNVRYFIRGEKMIKFIWVTCYFSLKFFPLKNTGNEIMQYCHNRKSKQFVSVEH